MVGSEPALPEDAEHVFIPRAPSGACCRRLSESLRSDPRYAVVFLMGPVAKCSRDRDSVGWTSASGDETSLM
jgi:hypothetical protein